MNKKIIAGLIAMVVIAAIAMFTGCVEKDTAKTIEYDASKDIVGTRMSGGSITVGGNVYGNAGTGMSGGNITVGGDIKGFAGYLMTGGEITAHGRIEIVKNVKGGTIRAGTIGIVEGIGENVTIYADKIEKIGKNVKGNIVITTR